MPLIPGRYNNLATLYRESGLVPWPVRDPRCTATIRRQATPSGHLAFELITYRCAVH